MLKAGTALIAALLVTAGRGADACSVVWAPDLRPNPDSARLSGVVTAYVSGAGSVGNVRQPSGLRIRIEEVVSGDVPSAAIDVYPLSLGAACGIWATPRAELERRFPIGAMVVVQGELIPRAAAEGPVIAVDVVKQGFVVRTPDGARWTPEGDLDFERSGALSNTFFTRFEFDRIVLALPQSVASQRRARLRNLALYPGFRYARDARTFYGELLSESGLPSSEQFELLAWFDQRVLATAR